MSQFKEKYWIKNSTVCMYLDTATIMKSGGIWMKLATLRVIEENKVEIKNQGFGGTWTFISFIW